MEEEEENMAEEHQVVDDMEEQHKRKRRKGQRRDEIPAKAKATTRWSFFDGHCVSYSADTCTTTKNSFRTKLACNKSKSIH